LIGRALRKQNEAEEHMAVLGPYQTARYLLGRGTGVPVATRWEGSPHPIWLRAGTSDIPTFLMVLKGKEYDFEVVQPAVIIDAGANIGLASIWFASKFPAARVLAVEAEKSNYDLLVRNVEPFPNVTPIHAAVWSHRGTLAVDDPHNEGAWAFQTRELEDSLHPVETVPCLTVADLIADYELGWVDLLKIDIEGAEREVFSSPDEWIGSVGAIAIELHDRFKTGCSRSFYAAVTDFPVEQTVGENVFVTR
jgi:FkbM family methyltransferase